MFKTCELEVDNTDLTCKVIILCLKPFAVSDRPLYSHTTEIFKAMRQQGGFSVDITEVLISSSAQISQSVVIFKHLLGLDHLARELKIVGAFVLSLA